MHHYPAAEGFNGLGSDPFGVAVIGLIVLFVASIIVIAYSMISRTGQSDRDNENDPPPA